MSVFFSTLFYPTSIRSRARTRRTRVARRRTTNDDKDRRRRLLLWPDKLLGTFIPLARSVTVTTAFSLLYIRDEDENDVDDGSEQQLWRQQQRWHDVDDGDEISRGARRSTANVATRSRRVDARTLVESIRHGEPRRRTAFWLDSLYYARSLPLKFPFSLSLTRFRSPSRCPFALLLLHLHSPRNSSYCPTTSYNSIEE